MSHNAPHLPLQLPDDWLDRYAGRYDAGYGALLEERFARAVDAGVIPPGADFEGFQPLAEPWSDLGAEEQRRYALHGRPCGVRRGLGTSRRRDGDVY